MDTWTISDNDGTASSLRLPNPRPDVYIQNILLDTPGIRSNILDLISETTRPAFNNVKPKDWYFVLD